MSVSINQGNVFTIHDVLGKLVPGGLLLAAFVALFPSGTDTFQIVDDLSVVGALVLIPVAYVAGGVVESLGGLCIRRGYFFQERIHDARHDIGTQEANAAETAGAGDVDHVARETWADMVERFDLPDSYLRAESCVNPESGDCELETDGREDPRFYRWLMRPLLSVFSRFLPNMSGDRLSHERNTYREEESARRIAVQYLHEAGVGRIDRFESLYVLFRSLAFLSSLVLIGSFLLLITALITPPYPDAAAGSESPVTLLVSFQYAPALPELFLIFVTALASFPVLYSRMRHYDKIGDNRLISTYYANVVASGTRST